LTSGICGMAGINDEALLRRMTETLRRRGGELEGLMYDGGNVGIACRFSAGAGPSPEKQPACNEDCTICAVCDGEILNGNHIINNLRKEGHVFSSEGPADIIAHAYEEHGAGCIDLFDGEFAFALWDSREHRLIIVRDRVGRKPLYYKLTQDHLLFASAASALHAEPGNTAGVDPRALDDYLTLGYIPGEKTLYGDIRRLPPGHIMIYQRGAVRISRYWTHFKDINEGGMDSDSSLDMFSAEIERAIRARCRKSELVGLGLNGDRGSAGLLYYARKSFENSLKVYSAFYSEKRNRVPNDAAESRGGLYELIQVAPENIDRLRFIYENMEEPVSEPDVLLFDAICAAAAPDVKCIVSGAGLEEMFGATAMMKLMAMIHGAERKSKLKKALLAAATLLSVHATAGEAVEELGATHVGARLIIADMILSRKKSPLRYEPALALFPSNIRQDLYTPELASAIKDYEPQRWNFFWRSHRRGPNILKRIVAYNLDYTLPGNILPRLDSIGASHGIEVRVPFLDHKLLESASYVNSSFIHEKSGADVLDSLIEFDAVRDDVPSHRTCRILQGRAFLNAFNAIYNEYLSKERTLARGWFRPDTIERIVRSALNGNRVGLRRAYSLAVLEMWCNSHID